MSRRLFVGIPLGEAARRACADAAERLRDAGCVARWVRPENYHLTLAFLGGVASERIGDVTAALAKVSQALRRFEVFLEIVGAFPNERRARVIWVGASREVRPFGKLCAAVRRELETVGCSVDEHSDPHVTLARADGIMLPTIVSPKVQRVEVSSFSLYESFTEPRGARYVALAKFAGRPK